jgi:hypothetical protein
LRIVSSAVALDGVGQGLTSLELCDLGISISNLTITAPIVDMIALFLIAQLLMYSW